MRFSQLLLPCISLQTRDNGRVAAGARERGATGEEEEVGEEAIGEDGIGGAIIEEEITCLLEVFLEREKWSRLCFCWGVLSLIRNEE